MRRLLIAAAAAAATTLATAVPAGAGHSWDGYHWPRTGTREQAQVVLGDNVDTAWDGFLATTSADWSRSKVLDAPVGAGAGPIVCAPSLGQVEVCNAPYGPTGWLGIAEVYLSGDHIIAGTVRVNDFYFLLPEYDSDEARLHVLCQEVGHVLGLDHRDAGEASCMNDQDLIGDPAAAHPDRHDFRELASVYDHADEDTGGGILATAGSVVRLVDDLAHGVTRITFVTLA